MKIVHSYLYCVGVPRTPRSPRTCEASTRICCYGRQICTSDRSNQAATTPCMLMMQCSSKSVYSDKEVKTWCLVPAHPLCSRTFMYARSTYIYIDIAGVTTNSLIT